MNPYLALAKRWEGIAAKMEKSGVTTMTANTHRLFANELKAVIRTQHAAGVAWGDAFPCTYMVHGDKASIEAVVKMLNDNDRLQNVHDKQEPEDWRTRPTGISWNSMHSEKAIDILRKEVSLWKGSLAPYTGTAYRESTERKIAALELAIEVLEASSTEVELPKPIAMGGFAHKGSGDFYLHDKRYPHTIDLYSREQVLDLISRAKTQAKSTT